MVKEKDVLEVIEHYKARALSAEKEIKRKEEVIRQIFKALIQANNGEVIADTIWMYNSPCETLWEYIMDELNMSEEEYSKLEKEIHHDKN